MVWAAGTDTLTDVRIANANGNRLCERRVDEENRRNKTKKQKTMRGVHLLNWIIKKI